jgi:5,5'-dehydrodivanillate O-demethylase
MLSAEVNDRYTRVGPGTPTGELMRRYWHPVAAVSQMNGIFTKKVRLLGEDLILYKDRSGNFGLIEPLCAHRRMNMIYGIPEEHGLRCAYHGWMFDETGACTEQPYEETEDPTGNYKDKIHMKAYPVQVKAGVVFTYMGPQPAPLLPNYDVFAAEGVVRDVGYAVLDCNWLQCQENSLDPVHLEWLHVAWANYIREKNGDVGDMRKRRAHAKIQFDRFEHGMIKRRVWEGGSEEDTEWKDGHPIVFPNYLRQGGDGYNVDRGTARNTFFIGPAFQIRTPIDDEHTAHWWVACYPMVEGDKPQADHEVPYYEVPVPHMDENDQPIWSELKANAAQDPAAWITQGAIADRTRENLGRSDKGIIMYRQMLEENIRIVEDGGDPMCVVRDPVQNKYIPFMTEQHQYVDTTKRQGAATMYSPILDAREAAGLI